MTEHQEQADRLEREAEELKERSERLGSEISDAREDWEHKRRDESVPGALTPEKSAGDENDEAREPWPDE